MSVKNLSSRLTALESKETKNQQIDIFRLIIPKDDREFIGYRATIGTEEFISNSVSESLAMDEIQSWANQINASCRSKLVIIRYL